MKAFVVMRLGTLGAAFGVGLVIASACSGQRECSGPGGLCVQGPALDAANAGEGGQREQVDVASGGKRAPGSMRGEAGRSAVDSGEAGTGVSVVEGGSVSVVSPAAGGVGSIDPTSEGGMGGVAAPPSDAGAAGEAGDAGAGGAGGDDAGPEPDRCEVVGYQPLDLTVSDLYFPFGFFDASSLELNALSECPDRAPNARGGCYAFEWTPQNRTWVGLAWLPGSGWTDPGPCIAPGAVKVVFQARGAVGGEMINVGMQGSPELTDVVLSDTWQTFEIPVAEGNYNFVPNEPSGVKIGFSLVLAHAELGQQRVAVDDIRWEAPFVQCTPPRDLALACEGPMPGEQPGWCEGLEPPLAENLPIDDFEDGDDLSKELPGGRARWRLVHDTTFGGLHFPAPCATPSYDENELFSDWLMATTGCGFQAFAGLELLFRSGAPACATAFDAAVFDGFDFRIRASEPGSHDVVVKTMRELPLEEGGSCVADCYYEYVYELEVAAGWSPVRVPFLELVSTRQPAKVFNASRLASITWFPPERGGKRVGFDFAIDDVAFFYVP